MPGKTSGERENSASDQAIEDVWAMEFVRNGLCGLCGNTGVIDTIKTAVSHAGVHCGDRFFCICPSGRAMNRHGALGNGPMTPRQMKDWPDVPKGAK